MVKYDEKENQPPAPDAVKRKFEKDPQYTSNSVVDGRICHTGDDIWMKLDPSYNIDVPVQDAESIIRHDLKLIGLTVLEQENISALSEEEQTRAKRKIIRDKYPVRVKIVKSVIYSPTKKLVLEDWGNIDYFWQDKIDPALIYEDYIPPARRVTNQRDAFREALHLNSQPFDMDDVSRYREPLPFAPDVPGRPPSPTPMDQQSTEAEPPVFPLPPLPSSSHYSRPTQIPLSPRASQGLEDYQPNYRQSADNALARRTATPTQMEHCSMREPSTHYSYPQLPTPSQFPPLSQVAGPSHGNCTPPALLSKDQTYFNRVYMPTEVSSDTYIPPQKRTYANVLRGEETRPPSRGLSMYGRKLEYDLGEPQKLPFKIVFQWPDPSSMGYAYERDHSNLRRIEPQPGSIQTSIDQNMFNPKMTTCNSVKVGYSMFGHGMVNITLFKTANKFAGHSTPMSLREAPQVITAMIRSFYQANMDITRYRWEESYEQAQQLENDGQIVAAQTKRNKADALYQKQMKVITECNKQFQDNLGETQ
ncbi:unnamed protein product [Orchesella dallaii]|uniref:Uncharacterized protein n=1 Tax=Orchesella dallaii TaxID=48710 RepID=A0ABP1RB76_9HEXA